VNNVKAGGAYVELTVRDRVKQGLDAARAKLDRFANAFSAATGGFFGGLIGANFGAILGKVDELVHSAARITDEADKLGASVESYQRLGFIAQMSGTHIDSAAAALRKFTLLLGKAEAGESGAQATLAKYGLSLESLKSQTPEQQLQTISDVLASMPSHATAAAAAVDLMGKSAVDILPLLLSGGERIEQLAEQASKLGLVTSEEDIARADALADVYDQLSGQVARVAGAIYNALVPAFTEGAKTIRGLLAWAIAFIEKNRGLVQVLFSAAGAVGLATVAYGGYQVALYGASAAHGIFTAAAMASTAAMAAFNVSTGGLPLLIGSIVAAIVSGAVAVTIFSGAFNQLGDIASITMEGVYDAIKAGNLGLAFEIMTKGMELAWTTFQINVITAWNRAVDIIMSKIKTLRDAWRDYWQEFSEGISVITGESRGSTRRGSTRPDRSPGGGTPNKLAEQQERLANELRELNTRAAKETAALDPIENAKPSSLFDINSLMESLSSTAALASTGDGFTSQGTFSSAAVGLLGAAPARVQEQILREAEKQTAELEEIAANTANDEGIFF
jgi:hypothetical protein